MSEGDLRGLNPLYQILIELIHQVLVTTGLNHSASYAGVTLKKNNEKNFKSQVRGSP